MGLWVYYFAGAQFDKAAEFSGQIIKLAPMNEVPALLHVVGNCIHAGTYFGLGEYEHSLAFAREAMQHDDPALAPMLVGIFQHHLGIVASLWAAFDLLVLGYLDQAKALLNEAVTRVAEFEHPQSTAIVLGMTGWILPVLRDVTKTYEVAQRGVQLTTEYELPFWLGYSYVAYGWAEAQQGNAVAGIAEIERGLEIYASASGNSFISHFLAMQAEAYLKIGMIEDAQACITEALTHAKATSEGCYYAELHRLNGVLALERGDEATAKVSFQQALEMSRQQKAKLFELRAATNIAQLHRAHNQPSAAHKAIADVYSWFTEGLDTPDLIAAREVLSTIR